MPIQLSPETEKRVALLFPPDEQGPVRAVLLEDVASHFISAPYTRSEREVERILFAVLKLSEGNFGKLGTAIKQATTDYRDVLVWAGFGSDVEAHKKWLPD